MTEINDFALEVANILHEIYPDGESGVNENVPYVVEIKKDGDLLVAWSTIFHYRSKTPRETAEFVKTLALTKLNGLENSLI